MSEHGPISEPQQPPAAPAPASVPPGPSYVPPAQGYAPSSGYASVPGMPQAGWQPGPAPATPPAPRRRRAWIGWTIALVLVIALVVGGCVVPAIWLFDGEDLGTEFGESVAVIRIDGVIAGTGEYYSGYVTPEYFWDLLDQAAEDDSVKALVLRVDSPGGTVAASEEIASYIKDFKKPVIVSSGDINASGAYMVSSQADQIWALPGTTVGSIGVISEIPNVAGLMDKLGVEFTVITAGKYKDAGSPYRPLTKEERALIQGEVDEAYEQFIDLVAEGRDMNRSQVESLATGWAWSGARAKELGLVDKIGTYKDALDAAAKAGGIDGEYDVVTYDDELGGLFDSLIGLSSSLDRLSAVSEGAAERDMRSTVPK